MTRRLRIASFVTIAAALLLASRAAAQSGSFAVGHTTRVLDVLGTQGEHRPVAHQCVHFAPKWHYLASPVGPPVMDDRQYSVFRGVTDQQ